MKAAVKVATRYVRAVNIERDLPDPNALHGYRLTGRGEAALRRIFLGLQPGSTQRAWRLTGPYGGGKSSLALLLAALFVQRFSRRHAAGMLLRARAPDLNALGHKAPAYRPLVVQGCFDDVSIVLAERLLATLRELRSSATRTKLTQALRRFVKARRGGTAPADGVLDLLDRFAELEARSASPFVGVLLIIDELGRCLDFAATAETDLDAGFFQALAERSAGERDVNTAVIGILHQRFEDYARSSTLGDRLLEWRKVAERFEEIVLEESIDGSLMLMADAIELDAGALPARTRKAAEARVDQACQWRLLPPELAEVDAMALYPLHPATALALSVLSRRLGQTERSVFSFLASQDVGGFQAFLDNETPAADAAFRLSDLCDYLMAHGIELSANTERSRRWAMLQDSLRSAPFHDTLELNTLKTIGVLNLLEPLPNLACTAEQVSFAVLDNPDDEAVRQAIDRLVQKNVLFVRRATDELCVWPRSSVDLMREYRRAETQVGEVQRLGDLLGALPSPRPLVAHRHYLHTGTLRTLSVQVVPYVDAINDQASQDGTVDGQLLVVPVYPDEDAAAVDAVLRRTSEGLPQGTVVAASTLGQTALAAMRDIKIWRAVEKDCAALRVDAVARDELDDAIARAAADLAAALTGFLSFSAPEAGVCLFHQGETVTIRGSVELSQWVSSLMDRRFSSAPAFHNELINRVTISTQAATARARLLDAMLHHEYDEDLGLRKAPPEKAIYRTLFQASGMHRRVSGQWRFAVPPKPSPWAHCWRVVETALSGAKPVALSEVIAELMRPPFGLRESPALVLCVAVLITHRFKLALREDGTFITELTAAHLGRLAKTPARFDARLLPATNANAALVERYRSVISPTSKNTDIGEILRRLYRWYLGLPSYTLQTRSLDALSRTLLHTLSRAGEPIGLLRQDIPAAIGVALGARPTTKRLSAFELALKWCVVDIDQALPRLLTEIHCAALAAFGLAAHATTAELRRHVGELCERAGPMPHEPNVSALEARTRDAQRDDRQWLESVANLLAGQPVGSWEDGTLHAFETELTRLATLLGRVAVLTRTANERGSDRLSVIGIHVVDATGRDSLFTVNTKHTDCEADEAAVRAALAEVPDPARVLARLLSEYAMADSKQRSR